MIELCALVPVYNHPRHVAALVRELRRQSLPVVLIDDGSDAHCSGLLHEIATADGGVTLLRHGVNLGKGAAVVTGLRHAIETGYSHALQIDADGQHNSADVAKFAAASAARPHALVIGKPVYDDSVPRVRFFGRYATHVWVWINTLSLRIDDAMCGFRIYPLDGLAELLDSTRLGTRMDFDIEILVRLAWRGAQFVNLPTAVHYPADGVSHFRPLADNLRLSWMHARLFFGMLLRFPRLLMQRRGRGSQAIAGN